MAAADTALRHPAGLRTFLAVTRRPFGHFPTHRRGTHECPTDCQVNGPGRDATLWPDEFEAHLVQLACVRRADRGRPNHWVTRLGGACRLDLNPNCRRSRPVVLQITLELAVRQRGCLRLGRPILRSRPLRQRKRKDDLPGRGWIASPDTSGRGCWWWVPGGRRLGRRPDGERSGSPPRPAHAALHMTGARQRREIRESAVSPSARR
jgi:hypothetical protein